jgi:hypothetical protein
MVEPLLSTRLTTDPGATAAPATPPLRADQRKAIIDSLIGMIEGMYCHLPQKRARYGLDPVQRLRLLGQRAADRDLGDTEFHDTVTRVFIDLRDAHTRYIAPGATNRAATLPLLIERYRRDHEPVYVVSKVKPTGPEQQRAFTRVGFKPGVTVTHWNAIPMEQAVLDYADLETAGRADARVARALESLTIRPLRYVPLPEEDWVTISFTTARGAEREIRLEWAYLDLDEEPPSAAVSEALRRAYNPTAASAQDVKKMLFATRVWEREVAEAEGRVEPGDVETSAADQEREGDWITGAFASSVAARTIRGDDNRRYGHLRIHNFQVRDDQRFIEEVAELVGRMPARGLVIDLRSNPGGNVWAAEGLLQLFTPRAIAPTLFTLVASDLTRAMTRASHNRDLEPWAASLEAAISSGASHSDPVALTPEARCNNRGQRYGGPVVAVVDANTYSAGDLFAAGFVDNKIGKLVSTDVATGGGGANVWTSSQVTATLRAIGAAPRLHGAAFTMSVRQAMRNGRSRVEIEDVGIEAQFRHEMTLADLTEDNRDLLRFATRILDTEPRSRLAVTVHDGSWPTVEVETDGIDRVVLEIDGIVHESAPAGGDRAVTLPLPRDWADREPAVAGYAYAQLRQRRRLDR